MTNQNLLNWRMLLLLPPPPQEETLTTMNVSSPPPKKKDSIESQRFNPPLTVSCICMSWHDDRTQLPAAAGTEERHAPEPTAAQSFWTDSFTE